LIIDYRVERLFDEIKILPLQMLMLIEETAIDEVDNPRTKVIKSLVSAVRWSHIQNPTSRSKPEKKTTQKKEKRTRESKTR